MNEGMPIDPMSQGSMNQATPPPPVVKSDYSPLFKIITAVLGVLFLVALVLAIVFYMKAGRGQEYIDQVTTSAVQKREGELRVSCDQEKTDALENPWMEFKSRSVFPFKAQVPRGWSKYEHYDENANEPLQLYFNPEMVQYDSTARNDHAALEVVIGKRVYTGELAQLKNEMNNLISQKKRLPSSGKQGMAAFEGKDGENITISHINGTKFVYYDKDLKRNIAAILLPFGDRVMWIKTSQWDKYGKYYEKFYKTFVITLLD